jgi:hypothetical protein
MCFSWLLLVQYILLVSGGLSTIWPGRKIVIPRFHNYHIRAAVLRIRIHRIHVFLGHRDPDPLVRSMDPDPAPDSDPSIIMQK